MTDKLGVISYWFVSYKLSFTCLGDDWNMYEKTGNCLVSCLGIMFSIKKLEEKLRKVEIIKCDTLEMLNTVTVIHFQPMKKIPFDTQAIEGVTHIDLTDKEGQ